MRLSVDEVFRRIGIVKGDVHASDAERREMIRWHQDFIDELTLQFQQEAVGDLSITHDSVRETLEKAYIEYRRRKARAATRRLLKD